MRVQKDPEASKERIESREQYLDEAMAVIETGTWREFFEQALEWTESLELPAEEAERQTSLFNTILQYDLEPVENNELYTLARTMADQRQEMKALEADGNQNSEKEKRYQTLQEEIALAQYRLDHGLETIVQGSNTYWGSPDFWFVMDTVLSMVVLISVVMIIIGGSILSSEFSGGTIKFLLINPVKRSKIFLSKYVTVLSMGLGCVMLYYLLAVLVTRLLLRLRRGGRALSVYRRGEPGRRNSRTSVPRVQIPACERRRHSHVHAGLCHFLAV